VRPYITQAEAAFRIMGLEADRDVTVQANRGCHIGTFENEIQAAYAYDREAVRMHHGASALNLPETQPLLASGNGALITTAQSTSFPVLPRYSPPSSPAFWTWHPHHHRPFHLLPGPAKVGAPPPRGAAGGGG